MRLSLPTLYLLSSTFGTPLAVTAVVAAEGTEQVHDTAVPGLLPHASRGPQGRGLSKQGMRGKATKAFKAKGGKSGKGKGKGGKIETKIVEDCAEKIVGTYQYEGSATCGYTFLVEIWCDDPGYTQCYYDEAAVNGSPQFGTCTALNLIEELERTRGQYPDDMSPHCALEGIHLKDGPAVTIIPVGQPELNYPFTPFNVDTLSSQASSCTPKFTLGLSTEVDDDEPLYLFFSDDGGHSYYNADAPYPAYPFDDGDEIFTRRLATAECSATCMAAGAHCGTENVFTGAKTGCAHDPSICCSGDIDNYGSGNRFWLEAFRCLPRPRECITYDDFKADELRDCLNNDPGGTKAKDELNACADDAYSRHDGGHWMLSCDYVCTMKRCPVSSCQAQHAQKEKCEAEWAGCSCPP